MKIFKIEKKSNKRTHIFLFGIKVFSFKFRSTKISTCIGIIQAPYVNYRLKKCKYVHFMTTEKFTEPTIEFFNKNFNKKDHLYLCEPASEFFDVPKVDNVIHLRSLVGINLNRKNIKKIIHHGLFSKMVSEWCYRHPEINSKKGYWCIWGGDLEGIPDDPKGKPNSPKDIFIRQNFKGYIGKIDEENAVSILHLKNKPFYNALAPFPITKEMIDQAHKEEHGYIQIQVNHSRDKTTLEMLDILAKWKDKNIRVSTVLSYGEISYLEEVKQKGREIFGDKFFYLDKMVSGREYTQFLAQNDILILNHNQQQGFGNTVASLNLGTKIFIKPQSSVYSWLNNHEKIKVFNTNDIKNMSFEDFIAYSEKTENMKKAAKYYDNDYLVSLWRNILNAD